MKSKGISQVEEILEKVGNNPYFNLVTEDLKINAHKSHTPTNQQLWTLYRITIEDYNSLLEKQNGVCAICGKRETYRRLSVDHDHKTGAVRGLLCSNYNTGIGFFKDSKEILAKAIEYLL